MLSPGEKERYKRHLLLSEVGEAGQEKIKAARVLLIGAGGLGSPVGLYLAAAGACHLLGKPLVHGAIYKCEGQATTFVSRNPRNPVSGTDM